MFIYKSDDTKEFNKAFLAFQVAMMNDKEAVVKMTSGARNKYAKVEDLYKLILPFLAKVSMTMDQPKTTIEGQVYTMTVVTHVESDQFKRSYDYMYPESYLITESSNQVQAGAVQQVKGSIETYVCRRAMAHLLCLPLYEEKDFDDELQDGLSTGDGYITDEQYYKIKDKLKGHKDATSMLCASFDASALGDIKEKDYEAALAAVDIIFKKIKGS